MHRLKEKAIDIMALIEKKDDQYDDVNTIIKNSMGDFPSTIQMCDEELLNVTVSLLDDILGDEIASYYLWECRIMDGGRSVTEDGKTWPMRNMDDVRAYVGRND